MSCSRARGVLSHSPWENIAAGKTDSCRPLLHNTCLQQRVWGGEGWRGWHRCIALDCSLAPVTFRYLEKHFFSCWKSPHSVFPLGWGRALEAAVSGDGCFYIFLVVGSFILLLIFFLAKRNYQRTNYLIHILDLMTAELKIVAYHWGRLQSW